MKYLNMNEIYDEYIKVLYVAVQIYYTILLKSMPAWFSHLKKEELDVILK